MAFGLNLPATSGVRVENAADHSNGRRGSRWLLNIAWLAILVCGAAALRSWFWMSTNALAFGPVPRFWMQLAGVVVSSLALVLVACWLGKRQRLPGSVAIVLLAAWVAAAAGTYLAFASPFARDPAIVAWYALGTSWLAWAWLSFFVTGPRIARGGLFALLALVAAGFFAAVSAHGLDGDALPRLDWRWKRGEVVADAKSVGNSVDESAEDQLANYPRFRGADGLGMVRGLNLARDWSSRKPREQWRRKVGAGFGSIAVQGVRVYTQEQRGEEECVVCYERASGRELWVHGERARYGNPTTGDGPRATPTVDGGQVYALGATGVFTCTDRRLGKLLWRRDVLTDTKSLAPQHGMVSSPLVVGELVMVCGGGTHQALLAAYRKATGELAWTSGDELAGYTSPLLAEVAGMPQVLVISKSHLSGFDPDGGAELWKIPFANIDGTNCAQPCPVGRDHVFASTGYGAGCRLFEITQRATDSAWQAEELWSNRTMETKFCSPVLRDGHAYGFDDGILECVSVRDGRRVWKRGRYGHGQLMLADDLLVILAEDGRVALVEASPKAIGELASIQAISGKTWNYPALAGRQLFVRNAEEMACYELPVAEGPKLPPLERPRPPVGDLPKPL